jgi:hypothetical protein
MSGCRIRLRLGCDRTPHWALGDGVGLLAGIGQLFGQEAGLSSDSAESESIRIAIGDLMQKLADEPAGIQAIHIYIAALGEVQGAQGHFV